jgi:Lar family restriction alleviation protein
MTENEAMELKPCPFCGGKAYTKVVSRDYMQTGYSIGAEVGCEKCGFHMRGETVFAVDEFMNVKIVSGGVQHMIERWNSRANDENTD